MVQVWKALFIYS